MHGTNQTYIERFTLGDPYTYTGNQCKNEFYRANSLIAHINIYNRVYPIPYRPFIELRGLLSKITETHHETINSQGKCENTLQKEYVFNDKKELTSLTTINKSIIDKVEFYPSLKKMSKTIKTRIYGSKVSTIQKVYRDDNLQYKKFEKYRISDQMTPETILPLIPNEKYIYHNDNVVQKIRNINSRQEQTKTRIRFDEHSNILNLEAFSQKNKTETLYSTKYNYNNHSNITCSLPQLRTGVKLKIFI